VYVKQSSWTVDIPVVIVLRALGVRTEDQIYKITAGCDQEVVDLLFESIDEADSLGVKSTEQAIEFIRLRMRQGHGTPKAEDVSNMLTKVLLSHIQVANDNFQKKIIYIAHIVRRILLAVKDPSQLDNKVNYFHVFYYLRLYILTICTWMKLGILWK
jgi:DNA-directed RNA polymerase III subunit RPC2